MPPAKRELFFTIPRRKRDIEPNRHSQKEKRRGESLRDAHLQKKSIDPLGGHPQIFLPKRRKKKCQPSGDD